MADQEQADSVSASKRLEQLVREGLESGEGVEVTDEWWEQWDRDLCAIKDFMSGAKATLPDSPRLRAILSDIGIVNESGQRTSDDWNFIRDRLRAVKPPGF